MLDLLIRNGTVITPQGVGAWDVGIEGESIVAVAAPGSLPTDGPRVLDATGLVVSPGGVEPLDAVEVGLRQRYRRQLPRADQRRLLRRRQPHDVLVRRRGPRRHSLGPKGRG